MHDSLIRNIAHCGAAIKRATRRSGTINHAGVFMNARSSTAHRTSVFVFILLATIAVLPAAPAQTSHQISPTALASILAEPWATPPSGSLNSDVTLVEYFDYNCPV